ncbi:hypothetical protein D3C75_871120 [compost metagenome]
MAHVAEVDTDLMRPPGLQLHLKHGAALQNLAPNNPRHRRLSARRDPPAGRMMAVAANGGIDYLEFRRNDTFHDRGVQPRDGFGTHILVECELCILIFRVQHRTCRVLVQTVDMAHGHSAAGSRKMGGNHMIQCDLRPAAIRMDCHARGLMDNEAEIILGQHFKLLPCRFDAGLTVWKQRQPQPVPFPLDTAFPAQTCMELGRHAHGIQQPLVNGCFRICGGGNHPAGHSLQPFPPAGPGPAACQ